MAKKKRSSGTESIDWYLISIDRLKQIGLVVLLLIIAGGAYWVWFNQKGNPTTMSDAALTDPRQALNALAASKEIQTHRNEFDRAQKKLEEGNSLYGQGKYIEAQSSAIESSSISRAAHRGREVVERLT